MKSANAKFGKSAKVPAPLEGQAKRRQEEVPTGMRASGVPAKDLKSPDGPVEREQEEVVAGMRQGWGVRP
jgi:hypothetical protein